jgi:anti-sigma factor RsiW
MICHELEYHLADYVQNLLPEHDRHDIEAHLAECASCRRFAGQLRNLESAFLNRLKAPLLSEGFQERVLLRIGARARLLSDTERVERKRLLQSEFEQRMAQLGRASFKTGCFNTSSLLTGLAYSALAAVAGLLIWLTTPELVGWLGHHGFGGSAQLLPHAILALVVLFVAGMTAMFQRQLFRVWAAMLP